MHFCHNKICHVPLRLSENCLGIGDCVQLRLYPDLYAKRSSLINQQIHQFSKRFDDPVWRIVYSRTQHHYYNPGKRVIIILFSGPCCTRKNYYVNWLWRAWHLGPKKSRTAKRLQCLCKFISTNKIELIFVYNFMSLFIKNGNVVEI